MKSGVQSLCSIEALLTASLYIVTVGGKMMNKGRVIQVMGPVVDVKFESGQLPEIL